LSDIDSSAARVAIKTQILVIGAGQAGLSAAYHLRQRGLEAGRGFIVLDRAPRAGGAWQYRWPSLTLSTVNRIHDLPGLPFSEANDTSASEVQAAVAVPAYFEAYEQAFALNVFRPVTVSVVCERGGRFRVETDRWDFSAAGIINATGTWENPYVPDIPGRDRFEGRQLHTRDYRTAGEFAGQHVVIVGGGISAIQLLNEISAVTRPTWGTPRPPPVPEGPLRMEAGRAAGALVAERGRGGVAPGPARPGAGPAPAPAGRAEAARGALQRRDMFDEIVADGVRWADGQSLQADVILWCTGFRSSLDHLAPLMLREPGGGIRMAGRLATQVARDPRIHLVGYGPSASTIGANRAGAAAARELMEHLEQGSADTLRST